MKKTSLFVINLFLLIPIFMSAQPGNLHIREAFSLNGKWNTIVDPYEVGYYDYRLMPFDAFAKTDPAYQGMFVDAKAKNPSDRIEYDFDKSGSLLVPGDWNSQEEKLFYYEGTVWYRKKFDLVKQEDKRYFVYFGAANYESHIYLNATKLGSHTGGFTPFNFEITDIVVTGTNSLIVKVDNKRKREGVPTVNTDWMNYGGITRDVKIIEVSQDFIADYTIGLKKGTPNVIEAKAFIDGKNKKQQVTLSIPELKITVNSETSVNGEVAFEIPVKNLQRWSPENPIRYKVTFFTKEDTVSDKIAFRTIETKGTDILLNGKPVFLRGICIHEENPMRGSRANTAEDARMLLGWAKELNCNFVRLAHYPHNEHMIEVAEELGIMVWEEIPVYWTIDWKNTSTLENAKNQLKEIIHRDKNRGCIIIWSMANETPISESRTRFLSELASLTKSLDNTRLISAAMEKAPKEGDPLTQIVEDAFADMVDVVSFNQYVGWYDGLPEKCNRVNWEIHYNKPVIISEFGGGALAGYHADKDTRWTEEFQEDLYIQTINMIQKIPQLRGVTPWILADFRSPRRLLPGIQDGWNRKGLVSETGAKKKAFWVLKKYYDEQEAKYNAVKTK